MRVLHDHPLLGADEIRTALPNNDLADQIERIRITPQPMPVDEFSKLWTTFQVGYRISAAYQVSVVLIDSTRPSRTPLPVLNSRRERHRRERPSQFDPAVSHVDGRQSRRAAARAPKPARCWETICSSPVTISMARTSPLKFRIRVCKIPVPLPAPSNATATAITVNLPNQPQNFPAGIYTISVSVIRPGETSKRTTNALPFAVAPQILSNPPISAVRNAERNHDHTRVQSGSAARATGRLAARRR